MEELDGHGVVCDVVLAVFLGQTRVAQQMGPVCCEGALELSRGLLTDNVDGLAEVIVGDALDDLDGAVRVVPVNQEVCAQVEQFRAVTGDVGNADDPEACEFGQLKCGETGGCRCCHPSVYRPWESILRRFRGHTSPNSKPVPPFNAVLFAGSREAFWSHIDGNLILIHPLQFLNQIRTGQRINSRKIQSERYTQGQNRGHKRHTQGCSLHRRTGRRDPGSVECCSNSIFLERSFTNIAVVGRGHQHYIAFAHTVRWIGPANDHTGQIAAINPREGWDSKIVGAE